MDIKFVPGDISTCKVLLVPVFADRILTEASSKIDKEMDGGLTKAMNACSFKGKEGQTLVVMDPRNLDCEAVLAFGMGKEKDITDLVVENAGGTVASRLKCMGAKEASFPAEKLGSVSAEMMAAHFAYGLKLGSYDFDKYKTKKAEDKPKELAALTIAIEAADKAKSHFDRLDAVADGVYFARDLISEPANILYPETMAERAKGLKEVGVKVEILGEKEMQKLGMNALLGVGQGSAFESKLIIMQWNGAGKDDQPVAFVGKGVTFDTGGISIKPSGGMEEMRYDMGGSAAVIGTMMALAKRKAKVNVVGIVGAVENMPSGSAQRPGDIVTSMSGQTVEVLNTDAEGRLVLADALWYCQDRFKPQFMVNLATLTGAIVIALGEEYAGLFSNNDSLSDKLFKAGTDSGEKLWRLPLHKNYDKMIDAPYADVMNIQAPARHAGSITAAQFLQRFVNDVPWAHLDIAGVAWKKSVTPTTPKGATAFGVRLLDRFVADHYEA